MGSFSREVQSKVSQVKGHAKQKWEDQKRAQADQVRDNGLVKGESSTLVPVGGESRVGVHKADACGQKDRCRDGEVRMVVQQRLTEEYPKVREKALDDRGTVESWYQVQQDEPQVTPVKIQACQETEGPNGDQVQKSSSKSPLILKMQPQVGQDPGGLVADDWTRCGDFQGMEQVAVFQEMQVNDDYVNKYPMYYVPPEGEDNPVVKIKAFRENFRLKFKMFKMIPCRRVNPNVSSLQAHTAEPCGGEEERRKKIKWCSFFKERRIKVQFPRPAMQIICIYARRALLANWGST